MAVTETRRLHRRKNGMANIFSGIDITEIEYLALIAASTGSTSSLPSSSSTGASAGNVSYDGASLNCDDSGNHDESDDTDKAATSDSQDG